MNGTASSRKAAGHSLLFYLGNAWPVEGETEQRPKQESFWEE